MIDFAFAALIIDYYVKKYCLTKEIYCCEGGVTIDWGDLV